MFQESSKSSKSFLERDELEKILYHLSHDMGTSTRAITLVPDWIREDFEEAGLEMPKSAAENFLLMERHAQRLDQLMKGILTYTRVGRVDERVDEMAQHDPRDVLNEILKDRSPQEGWEIVNLIEPGRVNLHKADLELLFQALISNAIRHSDKSTGRCEISSQTNGDVLTLRVADDGPGIEKKYHAAVFEMMRTLKSKDEVEGSGLGLTICKKLCEHYGGDIRVESQPPIRGCVIVANLRVVTR